MGGTGNLVFRILMLVLSAYLIYDGSIFLWIIPTLIAAAPDGGSDTDPCMGG